MQYSYHVHSNWSDGSAPFEEYIKQAKIFGLQEIGFSDHFALDPHGENSCSIPLEKLDAYFQALEKLQTEHADISIKIGLEADFFPETIGHLKKILQKYPLDYVIGSVHSFEGFSVDGSLQEWDQISRDVRDEAISLYWKRIRELALSKCFDFVGHLDLYKKFGIKTQKTFSKEIDAALDAIAEAGLAIELNTSGWHYPCKEAYPSRELLEKVYLKKIPILISADAHKPQDLIRDFQKAKELLLSLGFDQVVSFDRRRRFFHGL